MSEPAPSFPSLRWWFQNRQTGEITIAQTPNLTIVLLLAAYALRYALGYVGDGEFWLVPILSVLILLGWIFWGVMELFQGVNPFRRLLGLVAIGIQVFSLF